MKNKNPSPFVTCLVLALFVIAIITEFGFLHPLSLFGIGSVIVVMFFVVDAFKNKAPTPALWLALAINTFWLAFTFLMLPSNDAINALNQAAINANFWQELVN
ncbi:hypothetical protein AB8302_004693 [Vibrio parahaemolyticus]|nr:hypothetical protein [Vibrio parahaemolyticus]EIT7127126.1 hypothetical protein [Vibrio parahaemolyticus]EIT7132135.1 hypothetical protein [Vibrio parahaemolyticus]EIZ4252597.1 hypothetical protein [Vibrio parahaemolyticus]ELA9430793.1 hypothetical protein [Vibrio parahaemolyticus]